MTVLQSVMMGCVSWLVHRHVAAWCASITPDRPATRADERGELASSRHYDSADPLGDIRR
jgi:hypothetical protein